MDSSAQQLLAAAQSGDAAALDEFVAENIRLVKSIVKRFLNRGVDYDDLCQIGSLGLLKAIKRFDFNLGLQFSTYAVPMIIGEIKRYLRDDGMIKVSRKTKEASTMVNRAIEDLRWHLGREPTLSEIESKTGISIAELSFVMDSAAPISSIDQTINDDSKSLFLLDTVKTEEGFEGRVINSIALYNALKDIDPRDQQIITLRYYSRKTQSEVAEALGISQVQVSRIEKRILATLRNSMKMA